jgi:predicted RNA-binding Zn-ribbon protein involved in translation (DUF1610 family)
MAGHRGVGRRNRSPSGFQVLRIKTGHSVPLSRTESVQYCTLSGPVELRSRSWRRAGAADPRSDPWLVGSNQHGRELPALSIVTNGDDRATRLVLGSPVPPIEDDSLTAHLQIRLKTISGPGNMGLVSSPPMLNASDHTVDFACGKCGVVLMHAEEGQVQNLAILCTGCGSYNSTDL